MTRGPESPHDYDHALPDTSGQDRCERCGELPDSYDDLEFERGELVCRACLQKEKDNDESLTIVLPLPPGALNPNGPHGSWYARARALKRCRQLARAAVEAEQIEETWERVEVRTVFFHKVERRRDGANYLTRLKGYFDGIVDAGLVVDDDAKHFEAYPPKFEIDKKCVRVEITVKRIK